MDPRSRTADEIVARMATRAHGVATRVELLGAGLSAQQIKDRIHKKLLIPQYPGVYRVGHAAPNVLSLYLAAVKVGGAGAVLWLRAAGHLERLLRRSPPPEVLTLTERRVKGLRTTRARGGIDPRDVTRIQGIPVTTVPRTLVDLAAVLDVDALGRACHEAGVRYGTTPGHVREVLARRPSSRGATKLRLIVDGDSPIVLSKLERLFFDGLVAERLPLPQTNRPAGGHYVDCRWPDHRLTVELVSYRFHNSRRVWEADHDRRRAARARGDRFRVYTWYDVVDEPEPMMAELRDLLAA